MGITEGTTIGSVRDVLLDDTYLQVVALVVGGGGFLGGHRKAVAYSAVRGVGPDAVMVSGQDAVEDVTDTSSWGAGHRGEEMKQDVISEGGARLGQVAEVAFDPQTGAVSAVRYIPTGETKPRCGEESVIARADIVTLSEKRSVVRQSVLDQSTGEADAVRASALGQLVSQEPAGTPTSSADDPATDVR